MVVVQVFVLAVALQVVVSQRYSREIPAECRAIEESVERSIDCCKFPSPYKDEEFLECGFEKSDMERSYRPRPEDCTKLNCLLKKHNMINADGNVDIEASKKFFDKYSENNAAFKPAMDKAKEQCLTSDLPGPPHMCDEMKWMSCTSSVFFMNCPTWQDTEGCTALKENMEKCTPHFLKA